MERSSKRFSSTLFWNRVSTALKLAGVMENQSVLDFGCGGCVTFKYLSERGCRVTGCDSGFYEAAQQICGLLAIEAAIYKNLFEITGTKFDCILVLDVLEHIQDVDLYIKKLIDLAHDQTRIIISGPTENCFYKVGRWLAGFSGDYHCRDIYDIEGRLREKYLERNTLKRLYFPFTLFRISSWSKERKAR
jgi:2-polyprenyl-3-methyl-5-hydroxy-6-metoxy-1,4-benzoquinol methylase